MFKTDGLYLSVLLNEFSINVNLSFDSAVRHLVNDSRAILQGDIFCAVNGTSLLGKDFIESALANNCAAIIVETDEHSEHGEISLAENASGESVPVVSFYQLNSQLFQLAQSFYRKPQDKMTIVGITGTNGKTSCSQLVAQLFEQLGQCSAVIGTNGAGKLKSIKPIANTTPGATELVKLLEEFNAQEVKHVAMEVSSHALEQGRVSNQLFDIALFTNLTRDHLDYHRTMENYANAKYQIFSKKPSQVAIVNGDDDQGNKWISTLADQQSVVVYGMAENTVNFERFVHATDIKTDSNGVSFTLKTDKGNCHIHSQLLGRFNIENLLAAISVLYVKNVDIADIQKAVANVKPVNGRMEAFFATNLPTTVVDYAHTPDALKNALQACRAHCNGQLWAVFGCGGDRDSGKRSLMGEIAEQNSDQIIITNDNPRSEKPEDIARDVLSGCVHKEKVTVMLDRQQAVLHALRKAENNDVVLLAGKGHEDYIEIQGKRLNYNERELVSSIYATGIRQ